MESKIFFPEEGCSNNYQIEERSFWFQIRNKWIGYFVEKWSVDGTFLDLGGGNGFVAQYLQRNPSLKVFLIEPSPDGQRNALSRGVDSRLGLLSQNKDIKPVKNIGIFDVLEHVESPKLFLSEIYDFLDYDGKIFITVPAYKFLWSAEDDYAGHHRRYTRDRLAQELELAGFTVEKSTYFFSALIPLIFVLRSIPYLFRSRRVSNHTDDHSPTLTKRIMKNILTLEFILFRAFKCIPFGSSLIAVASKNNSRRLH